MKKKMKNTELSPEELEELRAKKKKKARRKKFWHVIDLIFGFFLATGIVVACACLALEFILVKGPSPALRNLFVMTMHETRRFDFISNVYLSEDEVDEIIRANSVAKDVSTDSSLISISSNDAEVPQVDEEGRDAYGLVDDDGDGIIYVDVKGSGFVGYMYVILDPNRVFVGMPEYYGPGVGGMSLEDYVNKYDALGGINAGAFVDEGGSGSGGEPQGLVAVNGTLYNTSYYDCEFVGLDEDGVLHVGLYSEWNAINDRIRDGVSFGPALIINGEPADLTSISSGINPRSAIGQRSDGAIVMLAIDGRQLHSMGATYQDVIDLLLSYGVVNACNLDGGSSSSLYYDGQYINKCSSASGFSRNLPNAFLFK